MKSLFIKSMACSMFILLFLSCKKDETKIVAGTGTSPVLTSTTPASLVMLEDNAADNAGVFTWNNSSFGFEGSVVTYTLQVAAAGTNFASVKEIGANSTLTTTVTVATLNSLANQLKLRPGVAAKLDVRVKASISANHPAAYSNVLTYTVTPYQIIIDYPSLYVPGAYQNWTPATAPKISSVTDNKQYEGFVYFADASEFKFTSAPNWDNTNYGTSSAGTLNATGGDNLKVTTGGYYLLKANTTALTWSATKTTWAAIGTATGSASADTPMTYDMANNVWTVTKALSIGDLSFRANGANEITFGSADEADGTLVAGGKAIPVTVAGTYKITFNVGIPGNYVYSIILQ
jgi:hypothetical protein